MITLRDYQQQAIQDSEEFFSESGPISHARLLWAGPTGCGKSYVFTKLLQNNRKRWYISPRVEIIAGMLEKMGYNVDGLSEEALMSLAYSKRMGTPIRLANRWMAGGIAPRDLPEQALIDEAHHDNAETWQRLHLMLGCPCVGATATPYRGTPQSTKVLLDNWGEPRWMITYPEAQARGVISMPTCRTIPLVDDDCIKIKNGEFDLNSVKDATVNMIPNAVALLKNYVIPERTVGSRYDRPTIVSLPSTAVVEAFMAECYQQDVPARFITQATSKRDRFGIFRLCESASTAIVHINVVAEGVDLKLRRLIDLNPTMSPVKWVQQVGRITRPTPAGEAPPELICCNRNLLRHAYILAGALPDIYQVVKQAEEAFKRPSKRLAMGRVFGTEGLGRLQGVDVPLANGLTATFFVMARTANHNGQCLVENYAAIFHPLLTHPQWVARRDVVTPGQVGRAWGKWTPIDKPPEDMVGFSSLPNRTVSEKQMAWWKRRAAARGLQPDHDPTTKQFQILPILEDCGLRIQ
jgi:superfamily II DNA or RNA helicase